MKRCPKLLTVVLVILVLSAVALGLWLRKQPGKSTRTDQLAQGTISDSSHTHPHPHTHTLAQKTDSSSRPPPQSPRPVGNAIDAFEGWMERYFNAPPDQRDSLTQEGIALAQRRRSELKALIREDPEAALALAIPYELRRELPAAILEHLETPVSDYASYELLVTCFPTDHSKDTYERLASIGASRYEVFTYGNRLDVTTKDRLSLHGMAIDEVLAMGEDPIRLLSEEERLDRGFSSPRVVAVGNDFYAWTDRAALDRLRQYLRLDERALGPKPGRLHWDLRRGEVEGVSLLLAEDTVDWLEENEFPELPSPYTEGAKTMLYIRARFSDQDENHEPINLTTLRERQAASETFWQENSYGRSSLTTTFTDTITLPNPASYYIDLETNQFKTLLGDARPLAKAAGQAKNQDWDSDNYDFYTLITSGGIWGYAGKAFVGASGSHINGPDAASVRTASHEFGHNLGLRHANYWRTDSTSPIGRDSIPGGYVGDEEGDEWIEYGHRFSVMSGQRGRGDLNEGRAHFTTGEKVHLEWLVDWVSITETTLSPIRLYRHDVKASDLSDRVRGVARAIKIARNSGDYTTDGNRRYWLSYRRLPTNGVAQGWLPYGLQVDWQKEEYGKDGSILLDMTPYSWDDDSPEGGTNTDNEDKEDAVIVIGQTYSDEIADIHITPIAQGGENPNEWIDVLVNIDTQDGNTAPEITSYNASSTIVRSNETVDFLVQAEDADGDTLYYSWSIFSNNSLFDDNSLMVESLNSNRASTSWEFLGIFTVRVTVSDGKGGSDVEEIHVNVGNQLPAVAIKGRVIAGGFPVQGARVNIGNWAQAWTDSDGNYSLYNLGFGEELIELNVAKEEMRFEPLFANPILRSDAAEALAIGYEWESIDARFLGRDWVALGDGPASGTPQLAVTPHETEISVNSQIEFRALAWDASGKRIEATPIWSVSGGGVIGESGLFSPTETGGPFRVTATQADLQAHALLGVSSTRFDDFMLNYPSIAREDRGHGADPDGDRLTNLAEFAMGGAPDVSEPHYTVGLQSEFFKKAGSWYAEFRYPRRKDAEQIGLKYEFQVSNDLSAGSWSTWLNYLVLETSPMDDIFEEVIVLIAPPPQNDAPFNPTQSRMFGRVIIYLD